MAAKARYWTMGANCAVSRCRLCMLPQFTCLEVQRRKRLSHAHTLKRASGRRASSPFGTNVTVLVCQCGVWVLTTSSQGPAPRRPASRSVDKTAVARFWATMLFSPCTTGGILVESVESRSAGHR